MSDGGKGCERRPAQVTEQEQEANWNRIFGKKDKPDHFNHLLKDDEMGFNIKNHIGND